MKGGVEYKIPMFTEINDPNVIKPIEQDDNKFKDNKFKPKETQGGLNPDKDILLNLQLFDQQKKPKQNFLEKKIENMPHPVSVMAPYAPPQVANYINEITSNYRQPFIYKDYHINLGPESNHLLANKIYTDALPIQNVLIAYKSLKERNYLLTHIRSTFINGDEGELISFKSNEQTQSGVDIQCITSRLKLLEQSPFNNNLFSKNPYDAMVQGLIIYRSCYPLEYDNSLNRVRCATNSTGINVRIYALTDDDFSIVHNNIDKGDKKVEIETFEFDRTKSLVWREIDYYRFIREEICNKYISPNFIQSYCYFLNKDVNLNFDKNALMKNIKKYSKYSAILLTESPNDSLYSWVGNKYKKDFKNPNVNNMVSCGIKKDDEWMSVLFQMLSIFYVFYEYDFVFSNIDVSKNFYIKNIKFSNEASQFWIYNINNIEYFVPNCGYLLLFDTYYCNKSSGNQIISLFLNTDEAKKSELRHNIRQIILNNARQTFSENNFTDILTKMGGVKPNEKILSLIRNISSELNANNDVNKNFIEDVILNNFYSYLNNRIGTKLLDIEKDLISENTHPIKRGDIVLHRLPIDSEGNYTYEIALYICSVIENECKCITKINPSLQKAKLDKENIASIINKTAIKQDFKISNPSNSIENIIETYKLKRY
jgi:hypothetical protein